jgi:hypothetical protein
MLHRPALPFFALVSCLGISQGALAQEEEEDKVDAEVQQDKAPAWGAG